MNISEAKNQIEMAIRSYLTKGEDGAYLIPQSKQRPILLIGAPGIGKTAIMGQLAQEVGIGYVSYSMTHHTRQSALGLPFIEERSYEGVKYRVSEYTMSEILAEVHRVIEEGGVKEGILFLDEVNCISETLEPVMLQFLQCKVFGNHALPEGWVIVAAGNPPEYNRAVREFDIVTLDRVKKIEVEPDYEAWKAYMRREGIHPAVLSYLETYHGDFYSVRREAGGQSFVTARGWDDLSRMMRVFEHNGYKVDEALIQQYVQDRVIAHHFGLYYSTYCKYEQAYSPEKIMSGQWDEGIVEKLKGATFEERYAVLVGLEDAVESRMREGNVALRRSGELERLVTEDPGDGSSYERALSDVRKKWKAGRALGRGEGAETREERELVQVLERMMGMKRDGSESWCEEVNQYLKKVQGDDEGKVKRASAGLEEVYQFIEAVDGTEGRMLMLFETEMTFNPEGMMFISVVGSAGYEKHIDKVLSSGREEGIEREIGRMMGERGADEASRHQ